MAYSSCSVAGPWMTLPFSSNWGTVEGAVSGAVGLVPAQDATHVGAAETAWTWP